MRRLFFDKVHLNFTKWGYNSVMAPDQTPNSPADALKGLKQPVAQEFDIHIDADGAWLHEGGDPAAGTGQLFACPPRGGW